MEEIEPFVRRLCNEEDLSVLTKKMVRKRYQSHFKKDSVSPEERQKINEVLDVILEELARGNKILIADGSTEESTVSPEQGKENLCDYQNHTSTISPAASFRHRIIHRIPRSELEGSLSGHTHLKQIGLPLKREHKKESFLSLSDRRKSNQDSGCFSNTFNNSADESSTTDDAEKSVRTPTTEGRVSDRSDGDLQCSLPCRHDAVLTDERKETEDDVRLMSVSSEMNDSAKGSASESVHIKQPSFQSKIEDSSDSSDYMSKGESARSQNTVSTLTEPKLSVDYVRQHRNQHRKVVSLRSAVAAVTSSDSDSCTEPRSKELYCVPKKQWRNSGLVMKTEPHLPHKLEAFQEKSNTKVSSNTNSIILLHKKSKDFNKTEHLQMSPEEETRRKEFAAKDSDYDASEECSSVFSSPAHVSTPKNWSHARLTARQAQDILVSELHSGDIPASLSGTQIDSHPQTSSMHPTNMDSGSAFHRVSPFSETSNAIIDTLLKISKKRRSAAAKSLEKRLRKQAFCKTAQISHPDSNSDNLPLMCIRWQRDQDNYVVASRHNNVRSSDDTLTKILAPHSHLGSDKQLEPYKTSKDMKVKNVFDSTASESSAQFSDIYFSSPSSSSKQSAKRGRGLGLRGKQSRDGKQLHKPKPQDISVYSLSEELTEDSSKRIRKPMGKIYKESDPWEVYPYCGESFRQAVIVLEDVSIKRRCVGKQNVKNSLHRKGARTVLKLQNKGLCHNAISGNVYSSDSDLIVEMDSSVYHKSPIVQPQQSPSESRVTAYAPMLLPIAQMEREMEESVLDASRDEEWMVSSSSSTDSLSGKTKITLRRKWTNGTKRAVGRDNGMCGVGRACSDFRLCSDLPLDRTSDVSFAEQANCEEKSKRRKINTVSSSDEDDSSQDALLAEDSSSMDQLSSYSIQKSDGDSDEETSELSKSNGSEEENGLSESPLRIKSKKPASRKRLRSISPDNKQTKTESLSKNRPQSEKSEKNEHPYLKRLKLICRKVGIFVRSDVHFAGCQTDKDRIERLKEVLRKAGMKGQPSLSKVDSVNLKKEAADLDPSNIIETSGRPRRQLKGFSTGGTSSSKVEISTRQQFSRIQDLVTESDSD